MTNLIEDYLKRVEGRLRLRSTQRDHVVSELRSHILEKVADLERQDPTRERDDIVREVLEDFGDAEDLALAYTDEGATVLRLPSGEVLLEVGRAVGRGTARFFKIAAVVFGVLLIVAICAGVLAYQEFKPVILKNAPYPVYDYDERCVPCDGTFNESFAVHSNAREIWFEFHVTPTGLGNGTFRMMLADGNGTVHYDRVFTDADDGFVSLHRSFPGIAGDWRVMFTYANFAGRVHVEVDTIGLPPDAGLFDNW